MQLYDWQEHDLETLRAAGYVGLLAMEPGSGKTVLSVAAALESGAEQVLVIAPQPTHSSAWQKTVDSFLPDTDVRVIGRSKKAEKDALFDFEIGVPGWYICTPQFFTRADIGSWFPDMLIVDEIHQLGAPNSKGQRKLSGYRKTDKPISLQARMRLALSGTPSRNNFERMWSITKFLWPERYGPAQLGDPDFKRWARFHMDSVYTPFTPSKVKFTYEKEPGRLFRSMPCVVQHFRRRECCEWHPDGFLSQDEPQVLHETVELLPEQRQAIADLEDQALAWFDGKPLVTEVPIVTQLRIRQVCLAVPTLVPTIDADGGESLSVEFAPDAKSPVIDAMLARLENLETGEPVVVFTASQKFAALATARFNAAGYSAFEYSGARKNDDRSEDMRKFGKPGGHQIAVVVISAGGTGLDGIQKVCKTEFWSDRDLDRTNNLQAEARADRMGARGQVQRVIFHDSLGYSDARLTRESLENSRLAKSLTRRTK